MSRCLVGLTPLLDFVAPHLANRTVLPLAWPRSAAASCARSPANAASSASSAVKCVKL